MQESGSGWWDRRCDATQCGYSPLMVNVANDAGVRDAELTAAASPRSSALKARELVTGLPLERLLELPSLAGASVHSGGPGVDDGG